VRNYTVGVADSLFPYFSFLPTAYGGSTNDPYLLTLYLSNLMANTTALFTELYGYAGTLFLSRRSINEWVFGADPLLVAVQGSSASYLVNGTNPQAIFTVRTGADTDYYLGMDYFVEDHSMFWVDLFPVGNYSVAGRHKSYPPFINCPQSFQLYYYAIRGFIELVFATGSTVKGIPTNRFLLNVAQALAVDAGFANYVSGLKNITVVEGFPSFIGYPNQGLVPAPLANTVTGLPTYSPSDDAYFFDVEPVTGTIINYELKILFNILHNFSAFPIPGIAHTAAVLFPHLLQDEAAVIGDGAASRLRFVVVIVPQIGLGVLIALIITGSALAVGSVALYVYWHHVQGDDDVEMSEDDLADQVELPPADVAALMAAGGKKVSSDAGLSRSDNTRNELLTVANPDDDFAAVAPREDGRSGQLNPFQTA
jgi:hypothetical protein